MKFTNYPRAAAFNKQGICVAAGNSVHVTEHDYQRTVWLPSDHYDFLGPVNPVGMTELQIQHAVEEFHRTTFRKR